MSSVSGAGGFRDEWMNNIMNSDGKTNSTQSTTQTGQVWNAVFEDENDMGVSVDDFLNLMVAQLQNQDFMNPVDDTQYVTQLAQFATMSQMQELAANMKNNYALSLVGTNVTAAKFAVSGALIKETGPISKVSLVDNSYQITVNGQTFSLSEIMEINNSESSGSTNDKNDQMAYLVSLIGKNVTVKHDGDTITGIVEEISTEDGYKLMIDGEWYSLDEVTGVGSADKDDADGEDSDSDEEAAEALYFRAF
ncbi:flagellar hook capping FlgD N-terminal domain-containing protein [Anaerotruncus colihominis]|uniref:flagellar hook assembly protein FlgD n=1 Tax=Anaerotruncus colihominis TaxID=169435 RepID=UPI0029431E9B|nr:flagellar hook capping FlgD N-terminal domain-containing protein [Anaerotruncus colihominis]